MGIPNLCIYVWRINYMYLGFGLPLTIFCPYLRQRWPSLIISTSLTVWTMCRGSLWDLIGGVSSVATVSFFLLQNNYTTINFKRVSRPETSKTNTAWASTYCFFESWPSPLSTSFSNLCRFKGVTFTLSQADTMSNASGASDGLLGSHVSRGVEDFSPSADKCH